MKTFRIVSVLFLVAFIGMGFTMIVSYSNKLGTPEIYDYTVECVEFVDGAWIQGGARGQLLPSNERLPLAYIIDPKTVTPEKIGGIKGPDCAFEVNIQNTTKNPISVYDLAVEVIGFKDLPHEDSIIVRMPAPNLHIEHCLINIEDPHARSLPYMNSNLLIEQDGSMAPIEQIRIDAMDQRLFQTRINAISPGIYTFQVKVKVNCGGGTKSEYKSISEPITWIFMNK